MAWTPSRIAHRGAHHQAPENTIAAFDRALALGVDAIELDVQLSKDNIPIVYHDPTLARIGGSRQRVRSRTVAQLKRMDWGGWFSADFRNTPLLTLADAVTRFAGRLTLMVEIKSRPGDRIDRLVRETVSLIDACAPPIDRARFQILSFDPMVLEDVHRLAPDLALVLNLPSQAGGSPLHAPSSWTAAIHGGLPLHAVCAQERMLSEATVAWMRARAPRLYTYSCNRPYQVQRAQRFAIDGVMTDCLEWFLPHLTKIGVPPFNESD